MFWVKNPTQPAYWFDKPLSYSQHARKRCEQRSIPEQDFLPLSSKLVDCTRDMKGNPLRLVFKVDNGTKPYHLVMSAQGEVLTVYLVTGFHQKAEENKNQKRSTNNEYAKVFGSRDHELIPKKYRLEYW